MGVARLVLFSCVLTVAGASVAAAQVLSVNTSVVTPGATVTLSITGPAGHSFAIIGSTVGSGFSYAGVPLAVGPDVVIHTTGVIGGGGTATVGFTPPFGGSSLDRYYIQLATSPTPAFSTIQASNGIVLRNADAVAVPSMGPGVVGSVLSSPTFSAMASAVFTASRNLLCVVSSSVQIDPNVALPLGTDFGFMRNAIQRNGDTTNDNVYGHYITSNGLTTRQPVISRTSSFVVVAGDVVRFGVYLGDVPAGASGASVAAQLHYTCY